MWFETTRTRSPPHDPAVLDIAEQATLANVAGGVRLLARLNRPPAPSA